MHRRLPSQRPSEAFTLVEVLIAVLILSIALTALLRSLQSSVLALAESRTALHAVWLLQEQMAQLDRERLASPDGLPATVAGRAARPCGRLEWKREIREPLPTVTERDCPSAPRVAVQLAVREPSGSRAWTLETELAIVPKDE